MSFKRTIQSLLLLMLPALASGGVIFGTISGSGSADQNVVITCGDRRFEGKTDASGNYRVRVRVDDENCTISIGEMTSDVYSYSSATRYDFRIVDGSLRPH